MPSIVLEGRFDHLDQDSLEDNDLKHWIAGERFVIWNDRFVAVKGPSQWIEVFPAGGGMPTRYQDPIEAIDHVLGKSQKRHLSDPKKMPISRLKVAIPDHPEIIYQVGTDKLVKILLGGSSGWMAQRAIQKAAKDDPKLRDRIKALSPNAIS